MLLVSAPLGLSNIFDNHISNVFAAMLARQEILSECCCGDFRQMFMLGNSEYFLFGQAAQANAIFERDHPY